MRTSAFKNTIPKKKQQMIMPVLNRHIFKKIPKRNYTLVLYSLRNLKKKFSAALHFVNLQNNLKSWILPHHSLSHTVKHPKVHTHTFHISRYGKLRKRKSTSQGYKAT